MSDALEVKILGVVIGTALTVIDSSCRHLDVRDFSPRANFMGKITGTDLCFDFIDGTYREWTKNSYLGTKSISTLLS